MADQTHIDTPQHDDLFVATLAEGDTLTIREGDWNDYVRVDGQGDVDARGGTGNDTFDFRGLCGTATVDGGQGSDVMRGGSGEAHFFGGDNNDTLIAGHGGGWFDGGAARDTIDVSKGASEVHTSLADHPLLSGLQGTDVIKGFGCDDIATLDNYGTGVNFNSATGWLETAGHQKIEYFEGHIGDTLVRVEDDATVLATHHQTWMLA